MSDFSHGFAGGPDEARGPRGAQATHLAQGLVAVFNRACDSGDSEIAKRLLTTLERMLTRETTPPVLSVPEATACLAAARERVSPLLAGPFMAPTEHGPATPRSGRQAD
jgi:hypothetical protein